MGAIQTVNAKSKADEVGQFLEQYRDRISALLDNDKAAARMFRMYQNAVARNPKLLACSKLSLVGCMLSAAEFDLEPNTPEGLCYVIPYRNNRAGTDDAQFQLGYQGIMKLAYRSGAVQDIQPRCVYENDKFEYVQGDDEKLTHVPPLRGKRGNLIGAYCIVRFEGGGLKREWLNVDEAMEHAEKYSKSYTAAEKSWGGKPARKDSLWHTDLESMIKKTAVIRALKYAPKSVTDQRLAKMTHALTLDYASERGMRPDMLGVLSPLQSIGVELPEDDGTPEISDDDFTAAEVQPKGFEKATPETSPQPEKKQEAPTQQAPPQDTSAPATEAQHAAIKALWKKCGISPSERVEHFKSVGYTGEDGGFLTQGQAAALIDALESR